MGWFTPKVEGVKQVKEIMTRNVETITKEASVAQTDIMRKYFTF